MRNYFNSHFKVREKPIRRSSLRGKLKTAEKMDAKKNNSIHADKTSLAYVLRKRRNGRCRLNANGRRTKDWRAVWRFLKVEFEKRGRTRCEFGFIPHECFGRLDPCHSKKRRLMQGNDIYTVALGCQNAHRILDEVFSHAEMETAVLRAIEANGGLVLPRGEEVAA